MKDISLKETEFTFQKDHMNKVIEQRGQNIIKANYSFPCSINGK